MPFVVSSLSCEKGMMDVFARSRNKKRSVATGVSTADKNLAQFFVHNKGDVENTVQETLAIMMVRRKTAVV